MCLNIDGNLIPDEYYIHFCSINFEKWRKRGIKNFILDLDNTLVPSGSVEISRDVVETVKSIKKWAKVCIVSNIIFGRKRFRRVEKIAHILGVPFVCANFVQRKPKPYPFLKALDIMDALPNDTAMVGDQIFTDILGAKRLGLKAILVVPLGEDHWATRLIGVRKKEKKILNLMNLKPQE